VEKVGREVAVLVGDFSGEMGGGGLQMGDAKRPAEESGTLGF